jgi:signal transduction histidine kinase
MSKVKTGLSKRLLTKVLSVYFILTLVVTSGQIFTEYLNTKYQIEGELQTLKNTFSTSLTRAIWELNIPQAVSIGEGLLELPIIEGVQIRDENGVFLADLGVTKNQQQLSDKPANSSVVHDNVDGTFGYTFPLIFEFSGRTLNVGDVTLYSSRSIVIDRIEVGIIFLLANAIIKTAFLVFLFLNAFRHMLTDPLAELTQQISDFDVNHLENSKLKINHVENSELDVLQDAYNRLVDGLIESQSQLMDTQNELTAANEKLDLQNISLEQEVAKKTASLSTIMLDLEQQKDQLIIQQNELKKENKHRAKIEQELTARNKELADSMVTLQMAKDQLLESERMASLGGLVAGITHDVNTPLGVGVTAASFLDERVNNIKRSFDEKTLTGNMMESFVADAQQTTSLLLSNLYRASDLIASFKQVAVDQTSEAKRQINLKQYLNDVLLSLAPSIKKTQHEVTMNCPEGLIIDCAPGAIAQIFTNLVINSLIHGFNEGEKGKINLTVTTEGEQVQIVYNDNGKGMSKAMLDKHFDAFFTTRRDQGGSGLGTHIVYNLVTQALHGDIIAESTPDKGIKYVIKFDARSSNA